MVENSSLLATACANSFNVSHLPFPWYIHLPDSPSDLGQSALLLILAFPSRTCDLLLSNWTIALVIPTTLPLKVGLCLAALVSIEFMIVFEKFATSTPHCSGLKRRGPPHISKEIAQIISVQSYGSLSRQAVPSPCSFPGLNLVRGM